MKFQAVFTLIILVLCGCSKPQQVILLDSWWNVDYAKQLCKDNNVMCNPDPVLGVKEFERELTTQFAAQSVCQSIKFVQFINPQEVTSSIEEITKNEHWSLSINYSPEEEKQDWQLLNSKNSANFFQGNETAKQTAINICNIVNKKGADISN